MAQQLTEEQVRRVRYINADMPKLCEEFGFSASGLRAVRHGITYKWLNEDIPPPPVLTRQQVAEISNHRMRAAVKEKAVDKIAAKLDKAHAKTKQAEPVITKELLAQRYERAINEGGVERMTQLETHLRAGGRLSEPEWELLTRLRVGLEPARFELLKNVGKVLAVMRGG